MPDLYLGIVKQTAKNLSMPTNSILPTVEDLLSFYRDLYNYTNQRADVSLMSRSIDFHAYGLAGAPGGETLVDMVWAATKFPAFMALLTNSNTGFIIDGPASLFFMADILETVYTANTVGLGLTVNNIDTSSISNVITLGWQEIINAMPSVDFVSCHLNALVDNDVLDSLVNAVNPGGTFLLANASNGSEMYHTDNSFPEEVHDRILSSNQFDSYHMQGYISFTCFRKRN